MRPRLAPVALALAVPLFACSGSSGGGGGSTSSSTSSGAETTGSTTQVGAGGATGATSSGSATTSQASSSVGSGGSGGMGAGGGGGGTCGGSPCFADEGCVSGHCVFQGCVGVTVPGDYASVQAAVTAIAPMGGTVCLGAQAFAEDVTLPYSNSPVVLQGVSAQQTSIQSLTNFYDAGFHGDITLRNLTVQNRVSLIGCGSASFEECALRGTVAPNEVALGVEAGGCSLLVTLQAVDASGGTSAVEAAGAGLTVDIHDSYIHDSSNGIYALLGVPSVSLINDTFAHDGTAIRFVATPTDQSALVAFNDLIVDNGVGIDETGVASVTTGANALHGNTTNYAGSAVPGTGYVTADPLLDTATPPGLSIGSPARGAGDVAHAPSKDYWGTPRNPAKVDIGAVQSSI